MELVILVLAARRHEHVPLPGFARKRSVLGNLCLKRILHALKSYTQSLALVLLLQNDARPSSVLHWAALPSP